MKSTVLVALLAIAGAVSSGNVTSTTTKPSTGAKKSTSTTKVTVPTVRPPVFPTPALFPPHVQNWPSGPLPQQEFTQPAFQPQTQFPLQSFAPQQSSAFPQAPQPNFFPQPSFQSSFGQQPFQQQQFPLAFGQQPAFQQQQFPQSGQQPAFQQQFSQPSFSQQPRVTSQSASPQNVAANTNVFATHPQSNFFTPVSHQLTQPSTPQLTSKAAAIPQKHQSAIQPSQSQQQQGAPAVQSQFSFPIPQPFQQNPQQFQQQSLIPNSNVQPFSGFQQWQPMANPIGASLQPSFSLLPKPLNPPNAGAQAFEQFQPSDSQVFNSFTAQQSPFTSFARAELTPWNPSQSNSFFPQLQQPQLQQLQQPQFSPFMGFPQSNSMFA